MSLNLFDKSIYVDPYAMFSDWRKNSPVPFDENRNTYAITRYEDVLFAFKSPEIFTSSKGARANGIPQPFMIDADDPSHRQQRKVVERSFTPGQMAYYSRDIENIAFKLIFDACENSQFDFVKEVTHKLPVIAVGRILGVPESDYPLLQKWGEAMVEGADGWENVTDEVISSVIEWYEYFEDLAKHRMKNPDGKLISQLLHAHYESGEISLEQVSGNALALLVGGNETARYLLSGAIYELLTNRSQFEMLISDSSLIDSAVEECVRYVSPVISSVRHATEDVTISDVLIKKDSQVMLFVSSANRDETIFPSPDKFDISRSPNKHIGFGFGVHYCLGASLAKMQLKVLIEQLLKICPNIGISNGFTPDMKYGTFLRGIKNLEVTI